MTRAGNSTFLSFCYQNSRMIVTLQEATPILNIVVPQSPHLPRVAGRPFFMVTCCASWMSLLSLHFMQYPVIRCSFLAQWLTFIRARRYSSITLAWGPHCMG